MRRVGGEEVGRKERDEEGWEGREGVRGGVKKRKT